MPPRSTSGRQRGGHALAPHTVALAYALGINLLAFLMFWTDKRSARSGGWRVSENSVISVALLGGWPAAKLAQRRLRHKTRKQPFGRRLNRVPLAWAMFAALGWAMLRVSP